MATIDPMSPDASPGIVPSGTGVRRVNNLPVYIVGAVMAAFLLVMALVATDRAAQQRRAPEVRDDKASSTSVFANQIAGTQKGGFIAPEKTAPPTVPGPAAADTLAIARPVNLDAPPTPPGNTMQPADQRRQDALERLHQAKLQQLDEAVRARTSVPVGAPRSTGSPAPSDDAAARLMALRQQMASATSSDPAAAYQARLQQLQQGALPPAAPPASSRDYAPFAGSGQGDRWRLDARPEAPRSPYMLRAGFVVPALLISGINAELPGQIMAQVSQDIFDTATGKWILIPQGSRLVGQYASDVVFGQSRVLIAWQRIVFPDGKAMELGAMPGADSAGYAGFADQVNNHYLRLFGSALLLSGVTAGVALSQPQATLGNTRPTASGALSEALGQQLGQVTAQLIAKNMNPAPTLEIGPGYG
jgi:type IV secretory pathway VirB10-like protein